MRQRLGDLIRSLGDLDEVELPGNNEEIAARLGTVREMISRTLSRMAGEGVIRLDGRAVTVLDRERL